MTTSTPLPAAGPLLYLDFDEVVALGRRAEGERMQASAEKGQALTPLGEPTDPPQQLRICLLVPRTDVGGGARILFEHANRLHDRGHDVLVLAHHPAPDWFDLRAPYRHVPVGRDLADAIPPCDLIVCGYWDQLLRARAASIAPVVHFEQGDAHLYEALPDRVEQYVRTSMAAADATLTINTRVVGILQERYGVRSAVVPNAIDPQVFHPGDPPSPQPYVIVVGWDGNEFKGMAEVRQVWARLQQQRPQLRLAWITPRPPLVPMGQVVVAPPQPRLAELYRNAAVYLGASHYETFPLPPLEAMASGTPVVTTGNVGVLEYARDGENALVVPIGDVDAMVDAVGRVLDEPALAARLAEAGLLTAQGYAWSAIVDLLEDHHRGAAARPLAGQPTGWTPVRNAPEPVDAPAAAKLEHVLRHADAREISVPVVRPGVEGHDLVSWEVVTRRARGGKGSLRVFAPHRHDDAPRHLAYYDAIGMLAAGRCSQALDRFLKVYRGTTHRALRGAVGKWIGLALLELGRDVEAADILEGGMGMFPDNADYVYLATLAALARGRGADLPHARALVAAVGAGTRYTDWFTDPVALLEQRVPA